MNPEEKLLGDEVIRAIKSGDVKMRPRWYFVLRDVIGTIAIIIVLLIVVYLASFIIFVLHQSGAWFVPVFGLVGWYALFNALPWILVLLSALFIIALAFLTRRYQFGYQWPLLYSLLGIIFLVACTCFLFVRTSFYNDLFNSPIHHGFPLLGQYYPGIGLLGPNDIHRGTVVFAGANGFVLRDSAGDISNVLVGAKTNIVPRTIFRAGDMVVVFGDRSATGTIVAVGIEKLAY